jgi:enolase-phosphatase E1
MPLNETVILLNIIEPITSINYIREILFPHVASILQDYVTNHKGKYKDDESYQQYLKSWHVQAFKVFIADPRSPGEKMKTIINNNIGQWPMSDSKLLCCMDTYVINMWNLGYETGLIKGHIYEDVLPVLKKLTDLGKKVCTYSCFKTSLQENFFKHTDYGDVSGVFSKYFDINLGPKDSETTYKDIANEINVNCSDILFLTSVVADAEAALKAGCNSVLLVRPNNPPLDPEKSSKFRIIKTLDELL